MQFKKRKKEKKKSNNFSYYFTKDKINDIRLNATSVSYVYKIQENENKEEFYSCFIFFKR